LIDKPKRFTFVTKPMGAERADVIEEQDDD
jgi:hypothetical protein